MRKMWCLYTVEYNSAIIKNEMILQRYGWTQRESYLAKLEKTVYSIAYTWNQKKSNTYEREIESQLQKTNLEFPEEKVEGRDKLEAQE